VIPPEGIAPDIVEDFRRYTSTAHLLSNPFNAFSPAEDIAAGRSGPGVLAGYVVLDPTAGLNGGPAMRFDFPDRSGEAATPQGNGRCGDYTISRQVGVPPGTKRVWAEVWARFSANWTIVAPSSWGCTSAPDYKFIFGSVNPGSDGNWGSFRLTLQQRQWTGYTPLGAVPIAGSPFPPEAMFDGAWHRTRAAFFISSTETTPDGGAKLWVDDRLMWDVQGLIIPRTDFRGIILGRTINQGPAAPQSVYWGSVKIWLRDPGW
jgi:hypothetical protein